MTLEVKYDLIDSLCSCRMVSKGDEDVSYVDITIMPGGCIPRRCIQVSKGSRKNESDIRCLLHIDQALLVLRDEYMPR